MSDYSSGTPSKSNNTLYDVYFEGSATVLLNRCVSTVAYKLNYKMWLVSDHAKAFTQACEIISNAFESEVQDFRMDSISMSKVDSEEVISRYR